MSSSGLEVTINQVGSLPNGWFTGGILVHNGAHRFIVNHTGTTIKLSRAFVGLPVGAHVSCYPGCDGNLSTCINKFNNVDNFGGILGYRGETLLTEVRLSKEFLCGG